MLPADSVRLAEPVPAIGHRERAVTAYRGMNPIATVPGPVFPGSRTLFPRTGLTGVMGRAFEARSSTSRNWLFAIASLRVCCGQILPVFFHSARF